MASLPGLSKWHTWHGGSYSIKTALGNYNIEPRFKRASHWDRFPRGNTWHLRFENVASASPRAGLHQDLGSFRTPFAALAAARRFHARLHVSSRDRSRRRSLRSSRRDPDRTTTHLRVRGRDYKVEYDPSRDRYRLTGKRGASYFTMRNKPRPHLLFVISHNLGSDAFDRVWLSDEGGRLRVVSE